MTLKVNTNILQPLSVQRSLNVIQASVNKTRAKQTARSDDEAQQLNEVIGVNEQALDNLQYVVKYIDTEKGNLKPINEEFNRRHELVSKAVSQTGSKAEQRKIQLEMAENIDGFQPRIRGLKEATKLVVHVKEQISEKVGQALLAQAHLSPENTAALAF